MEKNKIFDRFKNTLFEISNQININSEQIDYSKILKLVRLILKIKSENNKVFVYGAGRSGFIGRCFAQRLMHLNIYSSFISDAVTPRYRKNDLLILVSGSGETASTVAMAKKANEIGGNIALFTANPESSIGKLCDLVIKVKGKSKESAINKETLAPYTSLFDISALSVLDSIGSVLMEILDVSESDIDKLHASVE
ncbi:MAG: 6-phospho-3-hexuloisomerase [Candidatus Hodarchaeota archaeon]